MTGFEPFGGEAINPSLEVLKLLPKKIKDFEVITQQLPVVFGKSLEVLYAAIEKEKPDAVLCVGQAGGRKEITVERVGINVDDARIPDNEDNQPIDEKIFEDGENAYFAKLPIKAMVEAMKRQDIPAMVSNSAGTYVCNHLMYGLLYYINKNNRNLQGGFVHIPFITEQVKDKENVPAMELEDIAKGLELAIGAMAELKEDIKVTGGTIY